jgi:asparagine synthase (glutamine-hydrolysing)
MCGIAGFCLKYEVKPSQGLINGFLMSIRRRGPDDEGVSLIVRSTGKSQHYKTDLTHPALSDQLPHIHHAAHQHDLALIHTRYAILDLSEKGHQPFLSRDRSITGIFNGEIYNYIELRKELLSLGVGFKTNCDTEVLIEGYARWKDDLWAKLNGFWAVVLYDNTDGSLIFSRDRLGVAPLYYRQLPSGVYFSSYIEPLLDIDGQKAEINEDAVLGFAQTGFKDIEQSTFYTGIRSVPAACALRLSSKQGDLSQAQVKKYWDLPSQKLLEKDISFAQAIKEFRTLFFDAVDIRLRADVKIAFELSGGLDSSSVVAAATLLNKNKVTTYTAKIHGADEEPFARSMLQKYALDYHVIDHMEDHLADDQASFSKLMEEPFDNPNAYTHHQMLRAMKVHGVQVVLTGAGGDEVLAGYEASFWPKAYQEWKNEDILSYCKADWYELCRRYKTYSRSKMTMRNYFSALYRKLGIRGSSSKQFISSVPTSALKYHDQYDQLSFDEQRRFHFSTALLPFYMRSSDHFTMGIPVEHRFPLLDYRLVEFGLRMPISYLFRNGWTKYILRKAMEPYLPSKIIWRRQKMGFQFPFRQYFQNNEKIYAPMLEEFSAGFPQADLQAGYHELLEADPSLLWRLISIGIWQKGLSS